jgi:hypothetical protein
MGNRKYLALGMTLGIAIGSITGIIFDNTGLWIPVGLAIGAGIGNRIDIKNKTTEKPHSGK